MRRIAAGEAPPTWSGTVRSRRARVASHLVQVDVLAVVGRHFVLPQDAHRLDVLVHALAAIGELHFLLPHVLLGELADPDSQ